MKIPLFKIDWEEEDIEAIANVIKRGGYWTQGPEVEEFEDRLKFKVGSKYAVACNSGTSALSLALLGAGIKKEHEVIVPSFTFISTVNSVLFTGATPIFADIEEERYGLDVKKVEEKITDKTKAVLLVHYAGFPAKDTMKLKKLAEEKNILLIEDSAASLGAYHPGIKYVEYTGAIGDLGVYSFCQNKPTSCGEGGMIVTNNEKYYNKIKLLVSHGQEGSDYVDWGYNFRMSSINAALGLSQFKRLDAILKRRRQIAYEYNNSKYINGMKEKLNESSTYWIFPIRINKEDKQSLTNHLTKNKIATKTYYPPVHKTTFYSKKYKVELPVTESVYDSMLCLPIYSSMDDNEVQYVIKTVEDFYKGNKNDRY